MAVELFVKGALIGFSIAAPVGPIGLLCIRRTLAYGRLCGFLSGLGAAVADAIYAVVAGSGLGAVTKLLLSASSWLPAVGGLFLVYLGLKTAFASPAPESAQIEPRGLLRSFVSTLSLTLANPTTILSFAAVFASMTSTADAGTGGPILVLGIFAGSAMWWLILSTATGAMRNKLSPPTMLWINRICGAILAVMGCAAIVTALRIGP